MWLVENGAILTKDNMIKRNWPGSPSCYFCSADETIEHLFLTCPTAKVVWGVIGTCFGATNIPSSLTQYKSWIRRWLPDGNSIHVFGLSAICWAIWKRRNKACFEKKMLTNPLEIISHACALLSYWAGLYGADMQASILAGVKTLLSCAHRVLAQNPSASPQLLLQNITEEEQTEDEED